MSKEFKLTDPGEGLHEAEILEVHVAAGDSVNDGDTVLTVETDKASTDIPAPFSGTIAEVRVAAGDTAEVGDVLMTYDEGGQDNVDKNQAKGEDSEPEPDEGEDSDTEPDEGDTHEKKADAASETDEGDPEKEEDNAPAEGTEGKADSDEAVKEKKSEGGETDEPHSAENEESDETDDASGSRRQLPREKNVEMGDIESDDTDDEEAAEDGGDADEQPDEQQEKSSSKIKRDQKDKSEQPVPAAPSTRRLAREKNVELGDIEPSGKHGRVTAEDVEAAAQAASDQKKDGKQSKGRQRGNALIPGGGAAPALPDFSQWGEVESVPLRSIRRATATNMARTWSQIPHVFHQDVADVTDLERFRHEHADSAEAEGGKFTLTVLVIKALASALKQFPRFNASLDAENQEIVLKHYCHIGMAVATDRGLLVPVIRDVDDKTLVELSKETVDIARKTRSGEVKREDMQGGSMTVTNPGAMGGSSLTPLINHPQVAILGMAQARLEPVVHGDLDDYEIKPRLRLPLILGFDHRVNDGADAAQFVTHLINTLADPESLLLHL